MICIKLVKKLKNLKFGLLKIFRFFKNLKKPSFFEAIFQPGGLCTAVITHWLRLHTSVSCSLSILPDLLVTSDHLDSYNGTVLCGTDLTLCREMITWLGEYDSIWKQGVCASTCYVIIVCCYLQCHWVHCLRSRRAPGTAVRALSTTRMKLLSVLLVLLPDLVRMM